MGTIKSVLHKFKEFVGKDYIYHWNHGGSSCHVSRVLHQDTVICTVVR